MVEVARNAQTTQVATALESCPDPAKNSHEQKVDLCCVKPLRFG